MLRQGPAASPTSSSSDRAWFAASRRRASARATRLDPRNNALGGTTYFGGTAEVQFPIFGMPRELGMQGAVFADAGTLFGYKGGRTSAGIAPYSSPGRSLEHRGRSSRRASVIDSHGIRSSVGASLLWQSPLGPIRFDYAYPLTKDKYDQTQYLPLLRRHHASDDGLLAGRLLAGPGAPPVVQR